MFSNQTCSYLVIIEDFSFCGEFYKLIFIKYPLFAIELGLCCPQALIKVVNILSQLSLILKLTLSRYATNIVGEIYDMVLFLYYDVPHPVL